MGEKCYHSVVLNCIYLVSKFKHLFIYLGAIFMSLFIIVQVFCPFFYGDFCSFIYKNFSSSLCIWYISSSSVIWVVNVFSLLVSCFFGHANVLCYCHAVKCIDLFFYCLWILRHSLKNPPTRHLPNNLVVIISFPRFPEQKPRAAQCGPLHFSNTHFKVWLTLPMLGLPMFLLVIHTKTGSYKEEGVCGV